MAIPEQSSFSASKCCPFTYVAYYPEFKLNCLLNKLIWFIFPVFIAKKKKKKIDRLKF